MNKKTFWIITELYYPEETSTGHFLTRIAEGLAKNKDVSVICSQPTYSQRGIIAPKKEHHNGVHIYRCWGGRLNKDLLPFRIINFLTISFSLFYSSLVRFKAGDKVLVVTNPPLLPFLVTIATKIKKCVPILLVHDVYPEVLVAAGALKVDSILYKSIQMAAQWLYVKVAAIVVIGQDMAKIATKKSDDPSKIKLITNWADLDIINSSSKPENKVLKSLGLVDSFVVQYCGNMGRTHGLEYILEAAQKLKGDSIHFLLIGSGAKKNWLQKEAKNQNIINVTILQRCSRDDLSDCLNACDLAVISFVPGMSGVSVPSRMYNIMASGKPILAIADSDSELSKVVEEENIGWVVPPGNTNAIVEAITEAKSDPVRLKEMGERARKAAVNKYSFSEVIKKYHELFDSL